MSDFLEFGNLSAEINAMLSDLERSVSDVAGASEAAAMSAAELIRAEQARLLDKASFKRGKAHHQYKMVSGSLIKIKMQRAKNGGYKIAIGYDAAALQEFPELLVIEFGRPGSSPKRMKPRDALGRKKGEFPPHISHIRAGFALAKDKAADKFNETLCEIAARDFKG